MYQNIKRLSLIFRTLIHCIKFGKIIYQVLEWWIGYISCISIAQIIFHQKNVAIFQ